MERDEYLSVLATNFNETDQMKDWNIQREKKGNIYVAFSEYILCLEDSLEHETDSYKKSLIQKEIKRLKKEQKKYYVPSILEASKLELGTAVQEPKKALERSSFSLVKRFKKDV